MPNFCRLARSMATSEAGAGRHLWVSAACQGSHCRESQWLTVMDYFQVLGLPWGIVALISGNSQWVLSNPTNPTRSERDPLSPDRAKQGLIGPHLLACAPLPLKMEARKGRQVDLEEGRFHLRAMLRMDIGILSLYVYTHICVYIERLDYEPYYEVLILEPCPLGAILLDDPMTCFAGYATDVEAKAR